MSAAGWTGKRHGGQVYRYDFKAEKWRKVWMLFDGNMLCFNSPSGISKTLPPALCSQLRSFFPTLSAMIDLPLEPSTLWHYFGLDFKTADDASPADRSLSPTHLFRVRSQEDHDLWVESMRTSPFVAQAERAANKQGYCHSSFLGSLLVGLKSPTRQGSQQSSGHREIPLRTQWNSDPSYRDPTTVGGQRAAYGAALRSPPHATLRTSPSRAAGRSPPCLRRALLRTVPELKYVSWRSSSIAARAGGRSPQRASAVVLAGGGTASDTAARRSPQKGGGAVVPGGGTGSDKVERDHRARQRAGSSGGGTGSDKVERDLLERLATLERERDDAYNTLQEERLDLEKQRKIVEEKEAELLVRQMEIDQEVQKRHAEANEKLKEERKEILRKVEKEVTEAWNKMEADLKEKDQQLAEARQEISRLQKELGLGKSATSLPVASISPPQRSPTIGSPLVSPHNQVLSGRGSSRGPSVEMQRYVSSDLDHQKQERLEALDDELDDLLGQLETPDT